MPLIAGSGAVITISGPLEGVMVTVMLSLLKSGCIPAGIATVSPARAYSLKVVVPPHDASARDISSINTLLSMITPYNILLILQ